ncbi:MAG: ATP-binding protein [Thermoflexales bacterium]|nr:ATP-binding protein [Thermoflexales bacterium]
MRPPRVAICPAPDDCPGYYLPANLPPGHPCYDRLVPCACTLSRQAKLLKAELPARYHAMTFETFRVEEGNRQALELATRFARDPWGNGWYWLVLIGANGRGKTHLAAAIVNAVLDRGELAYFESVPALLDYLRAGYGSQNEGFDRRLDRVKDAPVLILDDLGAEVHTQTDTPYDSTWAQDKLYQVLDHRLVCELPSVITTNVPLDMLAPRLSSRLQDKQAARVRALKTDDKRKAADGQRL